MSSRQGRWQAILRGRRVPLRSTGLMVRGHLGRSVPERARTTPARRTVARAAGDSASAASAALSDAAVSRLAAELWAASRPCGSSTRRRIQCAVGLRLRVWVRHRCCGVAASACEARHVDLAHPRRRLSPSDGSSDLARSPACITRVRCRSSVSLSQSAASASAAPGSMPHSRHADDAKTLGFGAAIGGVKPRSAAAPRFGVRRLGARDAASVARCRRSPQIRRRV